MNQKLLKLQDLTVYYQFVGVLTLSLIIPFLVHLIPSPTATPIGAYLIPLFYIPTAAIFIFNKWSVSLAVAFTPYIYSFINGLPTLEMSSILSIELFLYTHLLVQLKDNEKFNPGAPFISLLVAKVVVTFLLLFLFSAIYSNPILDYTLLSTLHALPGIVLLHIIYNYVKKIAL